MGLYGALADVQFIGYYFVGLFFSAVSGISHGTKWEMKSVI
jgi:hypothetical protein